AKAGEAEALDVLAHVIGSGTLSRLYRALVIEKSIAVSAGAWYGGTSYDATRFGVSATPRPGVSLEELESAVDAVVAEVATNGITDQELARAKTRLVADTIYSWDDQFTLARVYGAALANGLSVETVGRWPDRIRAVSADAVQNAARNFLDMRRAVTGHLIKQPAPPEKRS